MLRSLQTREGAIVTGSRGMPVGGPLGPFVGGFAVHLAEQGYSPWTVENYLQRIRHMSCWMTAEGLEVAHLTPRTVERFLAEPVSYTHLTLPTKRIV